MSSVKALLTTVSMSLVALAFANPAVADTTTSAVDASALQKPQTYTIYSYHNDSPFAIKNHPIDLTELLVERFNHWSPNIKLSLTRIGRPALNAIVEAKEPYLILWANAIWFKRRDSNVSSSEPIFWDADIWVSRQSNPVEYTVPEDLKGLTIGGRKGFFYKGVNTLTEQGITQRIDQTSDQLNLESLLKSQIDAFVMSRSSWLYWYEHDDVKAQLYVAISPHDAFTRHILISKQNQHLTETINQFIVSLGHDEVWQNALELWGVKELISPFELELDELPEY